MDKDTREAFDTVFKKIDDVDKMIRGNGKLGVNTRLDRLEQESKRRSRFRWLLATALVMAIVGSVTTTLIAALK